MSEVVSCNVGLTSKLTYNSVVHTAHDFLICIDNDGSGDILGNYWIILLRTYFFSFACFFVDVCVVYREEVKEKKERDRNRKIKRFALIGLATVGGGTLIGIVISLM